jgi:hypothetical protein
MPRPTRRDGVDSFDQNQIDAIGNAIDRAWSAIKYTENILPEGEAQKVLAHCVMLEVQKGEINHFVLVNRAIRSFRAQRAKLIASKAIRRT